MPKGHLDLVFPLWNNLVLSIFPFPENGSMKPGTPGITILRCKKSPQNDEEHEIFRSSKSPVYCFERPEPFTITMVLWCYCTAAS